MGHRRCWSELHDGFGLNRKALGAKGVLFYMEEAQKLSSERKEMSWDLEEVREGDERKFHSLRPFPITLFARIVRLYPAATSSPTAQTTDRRRTD